jgi:hypothetical protein
MEPVTASPYHGRWHTEANGIAWRPERSKSPRAQSQPTGCVTQSATPQAFQKSSSPPPSTATRHFLWYPPDEFYDSNSVSPSSQFHFTSETRGRPSQRTEHVSVARSMSPVHFGGQITPPLPISVSLRPSSPFQARYQPLTSPMQAGSLASKPATLLGQIRHLTQQNCFAKVSKQIAVPSLTPWSTSLSALNQPLQGAQALPIQVPTLLTSQAGHKSHLPMKFQNASSGSPAASVVDFQQQEPVVSSIGVHRQAFSLPSDQAYPRWEPAATSPRLASYLNGPPPIVSQRHFAAPARWPSEPPPATACGRLFPQASEPTTFPTEPVTAGGLRQSLRGSSPSAHRGREVAGTDVLIDHCLQTREQLGNISAFMALLEGDVASIRRENLELRRLMQRRCDQGSEALNQSKRQCSSGTMYEGSKRSATEGCEACGVDSDRGVTWTPPPLHPLHLLRANRGSDELDRSFVINSSCESSDKDAQNLLLGGENDQREHQETNIAPATCNGQDLNQASVVLQGDASFTSQSRVPSETSFRTCGGHTICALLTDLPDDAQHGDGHAMPSDSFSTQDPSSQADAVDEANRAQRPRTVAFDSRSSQSSIPFSLGSDAPTEISDAWRGIRRAFGAAGALKQLLTPVREKDVEHLYELSDWTNPKVKNGPIGPGEGWEKLRSLGGSVNALRTFEALLERVRRHNGLGNPSEEGSNETAHSRPNEAVAIDATDRPDQGRQHDGDISPTRNHWKKIRLGVEVASALQELLKSVRSKQQERLYDRDWTKEGFGGSQRMMGTRLASKYLGSERPSATTSRASSKRSVASEAPSKSTLLQVPSPAQRSPRQVNEEAIQIVRIPSSKHRTSPPRQRVQPNDGTERRSSSTSYSSSKEVSRTESHSSTEFAPTGITTGCRPEVADRISEGVAGDVAKEIAVMCAQEYARSMLTQQMLYSPHVLAATEGLDGTLSLIGSRAGSKSSSSSGVTQEASRSRSKSGILKLKTELHASTIVSDNLADVTNQKTALHGADLPETQLININPSSIDQPDECVLPTTALLFPSGNLSFSQVFHKMDEDQATHHLQLHNLIVQPVLSHTRPASLAKIAAEAVNLASASGSRASSKEASNMSQPSSRTPSKTSQAVLATDSRKPSKSNLPSEAGSRKTSKSVTIKDMNDSCEELESDTVHMNIPELNVRDRKPRPFSHTHTHAHTHSHTKEHTHVHSHTVTRSGSKERLPSQTLISLSEEFSRKTRSMPSVATVSDIEVIPFALSPKAARAKARSALLTVGKPKPKAKSVGTLEVLEKPSRAQEIPRETHTETHSFSSSQSKEEVAVHTHIHEHVKADGTVLITTTCPAFADEVPLAHAASSSSSSQLFTHGSRKPQQRPSQVKSPSARLRRASEASMELDGQSKPTYIARTMPMTSAKRIQKVPMPWGGVGVGLPTEFCSFASR